MTAESAPHNRLWERLLAALGGSNALPADAGNSTPLEIARYADERLRTNLAVPFVEGYYLERRYGGATSKLSEAEAEVLIEQIESTSRLAAPLAAPSAVTASSGTSPQLQAPASQTPASPAPAASRPEIEESQPIGVEFLPKPKPAPKPAPPPTPSPVPRVEQIAKPAVAAKPKPQKPAKPKKIRRTFLQWLRDTVRGCLTHLLFYGVCFLIAAPFLYWNHWRHSTHWKLEIEGDATYLTALSDVTETAVQDPPREKIMIGCENDSDFLRLTWMQPMPGSSKPYLYQGVYLHHGVRVPYPEHTDSTTLVWQDHLFLKPLQGETSASDFQAVSATPENEDGRLSENDLKKKDVNVQEFLSRFSQSKELVLDIEGYLDSEGKHYEYGGFSEDSEHTRFSMDGLAAHLPELEEACHWNLSQP